MQTRWALSGRASAVQPASSTSGEALLPPPFPPDPPDPLSPLSPHLFPPLDSTPPLTRSQTRRSHLTATHVDTVMTQAQHPTTASAISQATTQFGSLAEIESILTVPATGNPKTLSSSSISSPSPSLEKLILPEPNSTNFKILQPNHNSPLLSNSASTSLTPSDHAPPPPPVRSTIPNSQPHTVHPHPNPPPIFQPQPQTHNAAPTLAETLRVRGDKSLQRLAPVTISETGRPRVLIPYFVQSVLCHMWGKGRRLEMHNNPLQRSDLVRIPSDFLRQKILEKNIWYVGDSMFHTTQWSSVHSSTTPPLSSIQIWAYLTGVPLDLRYKQGLSLVAGLIGEPKETDDFTLNLVSLTLSHVKVEVDLTKPLPIVVEFQRQSGEVVEVQVDYPWLPPTCAHCHELGHIMKNCLLYIPPKDPPPIAKVPVDKSKQKISDSAIKTPAKSVKTKQYVVKKPIPPITVEPLFSTHTVSLPISPSAFNTPSFVPTPTQKFFPPTAHISSDKPQKPSLKRTRSSPTISPTAPPKITYQSSKPSPDLSFPEIGTLRYLENSPFKNTSTNNLFYLF
ncbi:hypothetical protein F2Q68_00000345 [Brassica cretica]|uniref:DUF4283 domain-containing protein n=1 Tax=Brassica cretica TaxID=69181 RepID=A0A8S9JAF3_BRACR|nr:hypothetical protein F2Q68_00000345 [Brassica cretica]